MAHSDQGIARIVICAPAKLPAFFRDDLDGTCALCQQPVRFRPHGPTVRVLVCLECYIVHAEPGAKCEVLDEAAAELEALGVAPPTW
jgi:hypothetical protein